MNENLLRTISDTQTGQFNWLNEAGYEKPDEATLLIHAPGRTDFFTDPAGEHVISNAPFLYLDVSGNFRIKAQVAHAFNSTWDAAVLMVRTARSAGRSCALKPRTSGHRRSSVWSRMGCLMTRTA